MPLPTSKSELIEYSLKELGKPVINIEVDEDQASDRVDYCLKKFVDRHYDGVEEVMYKINLTKEDSANGYVKVPNNINAILEILRPSSTWSIEPMESIEYYMMWDIAFGSALGTMSDYYINMSHLALIDRMLGKDHVFFFNSISKKLQLQYANTHIGSAGLITDILENDDKWNKVNCTVVDNALDNNMGDLKATEITSSAAGVFSVDTKWETTNYALGTYTTEVNLIAGSYTGDVNIIMEDGDGTVIGTKTITLTDKWVNWFLQVEYPKTSAHDIVVRYETVTAAAGSGETFGVTKHQLYANSYIIIHGYQAIDSEEIENVWNQEWVLKYTTALIKKQWGSNTKKYQGVQLPGGIEMNGQTIFDEAVLELEKLDEQFDSEYSLPVDFFWG